MKAKTLCLLLPAVLLSACAASFDRAAMRCEMREGVPIFSGLQMLPAQNGPTYLTMPFKMAVAPPLSRHGYWSGWSDPEAEELRDLEKKLKSAGIISEMILIPSMMMELSSPSRDCEVLNRLRAAAARFGADTVLVLRSITESDTYLNLLAFGDLTLVGLWLIPGHNAESLTLLEAVLIDVRGPDFHITAQGEGTGVVSRSWQNLKRSEAERKSRINALKELAKDLLRNALKMKSS